MIQIEKIKKVFRTEDVETYALNDVNVNVKKGEFVAIMGPSGSGKSTLMHILGFLDKLTAGSYIFEGKDVSGLTDDELAEMRSNQVGFVFQAFNLLPRTTVLENVMLPLTYVKMDQAERIKKSKEALIAVGLEHRLNHFSNQLSGGEKQRVAIARSLVNNPAVIFADEPTGNLDSKSGLQVMRILQSLNEAGRTIILVTHEKYTADHARRILRVKDGLIIEDVEVAKRLFAKDGEELMK